MGNKMASVADVSYRDSEGKVLLIQLAGYQKSVWI